MVSESEWSKGIMFEILYKLNTFDPIRDPETSDIMLILQTMFLPQRL